MGKRSVKENKSVYQLSREEAGLTRDGAAEVLGCLSADRIEKLESGVLQPHPEDVLLMEDGYKKPGLCNYYCSHDCAIGRRYVPSVEKKELAQIVLETLAGLDALDKEKSRLVEIAIDGKIDAKEKPDFERIRRELERLSLTAGALQLWVAGALVAGEMEK